MAELTEIEEKRNYYIDFSKSLKLREASAIEFLYNLEPAQNNLFFINPSGTQGMPSDTLFRASKVAIPMHNLQFERTGNRALCISGAQINDDVTIDWIEDVHRSVENFHVRWMRSWYDYGADCLQIGANSDRFKNFSVLVYHYVNVNDSNGASVTKIVPTMVIELEGVTPNGINAQEFAWDNGAPSKYSCNYKVSRVRFYYLETKESIKGEIDGAPDTMRGSGTFYDTYYAQTLGNFINLVNKGPAGNWDSGTSIYAQKDFYN